MLITRRRGQPAVLISLEDYSALEETAYQLRSPANARRLRSARDQVEKEIRRRARGARRR